MMLKKLHLEKVFNKNIILGIIACVFFSGCGGAAGGDDTTDIRSLVDNITDIVDSAPEADSGADDVVNTPNTPNTPDISNTPGPTDSVTEEVVDTSDVKSLVTTFAGLTWTPSDFYEDGQSMNPSEIGYYEVIYGSSPDTMTDVAEVSIGDLRSFEIEAEVGSLAYAAVRTVSIYGSRSEASNVVTLTF